jgi:hypothetical protein
VLVLVAGLLASGRGGVSLADAAHQMQGVSMRGDATLELEGAPSKKGKLLLSADSKRMRLDFPEQTTVTIGEDSWTSGRVVEAALPEGKRWLHDAHGGFADYAPMSFEGVLASLGASPDMQKRGETVIDGKRVTHYAGTVDLKMIVETASADELPTMALECSIDESTGLPVRIKTDWTMDDETVTFTVDKLEFDVPTDSIQAPPSAETVPASDFR